MIEADLADYNRAKLDHDLIMAITNPVTFVTFSHSLGSKVFPKKLDIIS